MRHVETLEGADRFDDLIAAAERGEVTTFLKDGAAVACLVPSPRAGRSKAVDRLSAIAERLRQRNFSLSRDEILSARDEGR